MNRLWNKSMLLLGVLCLAFPVPAAAGEFLPPSLEPEPQHRDPYDWDARHETVKKRNGTVKPEYVVIGDSIIHHWGGEASGASKKTGEDSWRNVFGKHLVTNMGFGCDYVDNNYYRVQTGELDGISPRVIIILLGTNNLTALVRLIRQKCPSSKILLLGILPKMENGLALPISRTNGLQEKLHDGRDVFFANPGKALLSEDGVSPWKDLLKDTVHSGAKGYEVLGGEISAQLKKMNPEYRGGKVVRGGKLWFLDSQENLP